ncbi:carboxypeptidase-like regulatory domain-containing protein [Thalassoroseus pseudoceratinae]|uniref:carboxypeptidase-like regulatory domain-containing protein n=1 Tax=Thalassoroseus pseudoceratinae TaxID=2713176 RepID=UPI00141F5BCC|nr:carboxypeptidase-like regulatory domain-containing protein [Thalassoroseus pseudoceratinae]
MLKLQLMLMSTVCLAISSGCGGSPEVPGRPKTTPVSITVTQGGEPVEGATVAFIPTDPANGHAGSAITDDQGQAEPRTFEQGDGLVPGAYVVTVVKKDAPSQTGTASEDESDYQPPVPGQPAATPKNLLPPQYAEPAKSPLKATILETDEEQELTFTIE